MPGFTFNANSIYWQCYGNGRDVRRWSRTLTHSLCGKPSHMVGVPTKVSWALSDDEMYSSMQRENASTHSVESVGYWQWAQFDQRSKGQKMRLGVVLSLALLGSAWAAQGPKVKIGQGTLVGKTMPSRLGNKIYAFQGIPYAAAPVGELRFMVWNFAYLFTVNTETLSNHDAGSLIFVWEWENLICV